MNFRKYTYFCSENNLGDLISLGRGLFSTKFREEALREFPRVFSKVVDRKHSFTFGSGRMALFAILKAINISPGDEVIIQAFTCNVVPRAIIALGAVPVYADIEKTNFNINFDSADQLVTKKTKAIIVQHTFGIKPDIIKLRKFLKKHKMDVIEDCAHCVTPIVKTDLDLDKRLVFFSTDHTKLINTHVGGLASCDDSVIAGRLETIQLESRPIRCVDKIKIIISLFFEVLSHQSYLYHLMRPVFYLFRKSPLYFCWDDKHNCAINDSRLGGMYQLSWIQAVMGLRQIKNVTEIVSQRITLSRILNEKYHYYDSDNQLPYLRFAFLVDNRDMFYASNYRMIRHSTWFKDVITGGDDFYKEIKYDIGSCPDAEYVASKVVNLPLSSKISERLYM